MSESRGGESRAYSSNTSSYGESRGGESRVSHSTNTTNDTQKNPYDKLLLDMYKSDPDPYLEGILEALGILPKEENERKHKKQVSDIGDIRSQVMQELYDELYGEIKEEVRQELEKEKPEIVGEIKEELKAKLKAGLKRKLTQGRGEEK